MEIVTNGCGISAACQDIMWGMGPPEVLVAHTFD